MSSPRAEPSSNPLVLVVDRLGLFGDFVAAALEPVGYRVARCESADAATEILSQHEVRAVLADVCVPGQDLLDGVASLTREHAAPRTIVVAGCPVMDAAARVLYPGADAFLQKPCTTDELRALVAETSAGTAVREVPSTPVHGIVGISPAIRRVIEQIHRVAPTRATVLITGETGTGKELVGEAIHECSPRSGRPYVIVDTASLPDTLLESELFGHTRGAFTGATDDKPGLFQAADGGTIFLDEVGDVPTSVQVRLLRAIQEGQIRRVGAVEPSEIDVRVVAATQRDPEEAVESGRLRADLYYRLSAYTIRIPPLRERVEDIRPLVEYALSPAGTVGSGRVSCSELAVRMLESYDWPGNVRELLGVLQEARIEAGSPHIGATDLPERIRDAWREERLGGPEPDEREALVRALEETGGLKGAAADLLGISRTTLWRWMKRYDL